VQSPRSHSQQPRTLTPWLLPSPWTCWVGRQVSTPPRELTPPPRGRRYLCRGRSGQPGGSAGGRRSTARRGSRGSGVRCPGSPPRSRWWGARQGGRPGGQRDATCRSWRGGEGKGTGVRRAGAGVPYVSVILHGLLQGAAGQLGLCPVPQPAVQGPQVGLHAWTPGEVLRGGGER